MNCSVSKHSVLSFNGQTFPYQSLRHTNRTFVLGNEVEDVPSKTCLAQCGITGPIDLQRLKAVEVGESGENGSGGDAALDELSGRFLSQERD